MKEVEEKLSIITEACEERNGIDLKVINIRELSSIADYFVIVSGNSSTQAKAIADEIERSMYEEGHVRMSKDGYQGGRWILLDFGDIVVHVFHREERDYYNLERLWIDNNNDK